ncbi:DUF6515 family protein [Flammeovirga kamogawensis]|uniref:Uncharacterized protein n=1 Tax=Flammeovirga kamogawensis TaxID=373891 RepID=A0ABX8H2E8_9BACT|nr:DUF6515 family protein [Flammeovirga kamogawensis]MBB6463568.1 hypothetical protein [Flammeovirga kamogawensis]QWG09794.1 hypothetical protein KM029_19125 [Flammeovirga kamogawensis]TRX65302.1 hypothetical protein EO216_22530 [Flammeovirga kamogawensis]
MNILRSSLSILLLGILFLTNTSFAQVRRVYPTRNTTVVHHGPTYVNRGPTVVHTGPTYVHRGPVVVAPHPVYYGAPMYGPYWHPVGATVATIATTAIIVHAIDENNQKQDYYCDKGVYYEKQPSGNYKVVAAPIGSTIKTLPTGNVTLIVSGKTYYYFAGNYYQANPSGGYAVITAPQGAVVNALPEGTTTEIVNGITYHVCNGIWYTSVPQTDNTVNYAVTTPKN